MCLLFYFNQACKKLEDDLASLEIQTQENEKLKTKSQTDLVNEKGKVVYIILQIKKKKKEVNFIYVTYL